MFDGLLPQLTEARTPPTLAQLEEVVSNQTLLVAATTTYAFCGR